MERQSQVNRIQIKIEEYLMWLVCCLFISSFQFGIHKDNSHIVDTLLTVLPRLFLIELNIKSINK